MIELKSCPFCGCSAEVMLYHRVWIVRCTNEECGAEIENGDGGEEDTIRKWNRRANPSD